jgi:hypothetical protein
MDLIEKVLVPCETVDRGMFDNERLVTVHDYDTGETLPMFASSCVLVERGERTYIRVTQLGIDDETGLSVCILPVEGTETPSCTRWLRTRRSELLAP